jgi:hypothetical protein
MKIQKELDETKIVLHKTIESVLERGEYICCVCVQWGVDADAVCRREDR